MPIVKFNLATKRMGIGKIKLEDIDYKYKIESVIDFSSSAQSIGIIPASMTIEKIVVKILEPFANLGENFQLSIGADSIQNGTLMHWSEISPQNIGTYDSEPDESFEVDIDARAYLTGALIKGEANIIIYYR